MTFPGVKAVDRISCRGRTRKWIGNSARRSGPRAGMGECRSGTNCLHTGHCLNHGKGLSGRPVVKGWQFCCGRAIRRANMNSQQTVDSPENVPEWHMPWPAFEIDWNHAALIIVDLQNCGCNCSVGIPQMLQARYPAIAQYYLPRLQQTVIPNAVRLLEAFRASSRQVVFTRHGPLQRRRTPDNLISLPQTSGGDQRAAAHPPIHPAARLPCDSACHRMLS